MTVTIKSYSNGRQLANIEIDKNGLYIARLCDNYGCEVYRVEKEYTNYDRKKALAAYNRYKREVRQ